MSRIQPQNLSPEELVRYAELHNVDGLPKDWCQELIACLDAYVTKYGALADEGYAQTQEELF